MIYWIKGFTGFSDYWIEIKNNGQEIGHLLVEFNEVIKHGNGDITKQNWQNTVTERYQVTV